MSRRRYISFGVLLVLSVLLMTGVQARVSFSKSKRAKFSLGPSGDYLQNGSTLVVATHLTNDGGRKVHNVQLKSVALNSVPLLSPSVPISLGDIDVGQQVTLQLTFSTNGLVTGQPYPLVVHGSYRSSDEEGDKGDDEGEIAHAKGQQPHRSANDDNGDERGLKFTAKDVIQLPPASPGSAALNTTSVGSLSVSGAPFRHRQPNFAEEENGSRWTVPTGPLVAATPTPTGTAVQQAHTAARSGRAMADPTVIINANNPLGIQGSTCCAEPSGANSSGVIFATSNFFGAYSTDGGSTWKQLDPTTIFPNDNVGLCCDQIVQYVPSIDRFIWLIQGTDATAVNQPNGVRIASASPADIINNNGTAWTYWNLTPDVFGEPIGTGFDYPDLSVGNNYLYMSWDVGWPGCPTGCNSGHLIARTPLSEIQAGGTINLGYTTPSDSGSAWGAHLSQNTSDTIFWAGQTNNSTVRVFWAPESGNNYFWQDVGISTWANNTLSSTTPDGQDWLNKASGFPGNATIGSTRSGNQVWFGWNAGTDSNFQQPHVEMLTLDYSNNFNVLQQVQIWNNSYAFAYPALTTNACTGEVGLSLEYGGNGNYENHVVGFWGDFLVYITTNSNVGTTRFGDYVTIRQQQPTTDNPGNLFDAFGYGLNSVPPPGSGSQTDIRYVSFGRPPSSCVTLQ